MADCDGGKHEAPRVTGPYYGDDGVFRKTRGNPVRPIIRFNPGQSRPLPVAGRVTERPSSERKREQSEGIIRHSETTFTFSLSESIERDLTVALVGYVKSERLLFAPKHKSSMDVTCCSMV